MQYVWQHLLFDMSQLTTTDGRHLQIIDAGRLNTDAGPDFSMPKYVLTDAYGWEI